MRKNRITQIVAVFLCVMLLVLASGCSIVEKPLVIGSGIMDGKFSPFFYTSGYDGDVVEKTQIPLLYLDQYGEPQAGDEWPCLAYSYTQQTDAAKPTSTYKIVLKNGVAFSDGEPVTLKDVLFTIYTFCDPLYDGANTFYSIDIQGLDEYRLQTNAETLEMADAILAAGIGASDDGSPTYPAVDGATVEQQAAFWSYLDQAGEKFAQDIVNYVMNNLLENDYIQAYFSPDMTADEIKASDFLTVAFSMALWGYGSLSSDFPYENGVFTDSLGNTYDVASDTLTAADFWKNIFANYGYDISDAGINCEKTGELRVEEYVRGLYLANEGVIEGGVDSISGITTGTETCEDGVDRDYIQIVTDGIDPTAVYQMALRSARFIIIPTDLKAN